MLCNIDRIVVRYQKTKFTLGLRTFDPDDGSKPKAFDTATHREFEFLKNESITGLRTIGSDTGATYSPELAIFENKGFASASAPTLAGDTHFSIDLASADAGAIAFWTEGAEFLMRVKTATMTGSQATLVDYANRGLRRIFLDYEFATLGDMPGVILQTAVATANTLSTFNLLDGLTSNDVYNDLRCRIVSSTSPATVSDRIINDYVGATKTLVLATAALSASVGDYVTIYSRDHGPVLNPVITANFRGATVDEYLVTLHEDLSMVPNTTAGLVCNLKAVKSTGETLLAAGNAVAAGDGSFRRTSATRLGAGESALVTIVVTKNNKSTTYERPISRD